MTLEEAQEKFEKKFKFKNRNFKFKLASSLIVIGLVFFLTSNIILNKEIDKYSSSIGTTLTLEGNNIKFMDREYNSETGLLRLDFSVINNGIDSNKDLKVELIEKNDTQKALPIKVIKVTDNDYVVYANLKKWSAVALKIIDENKLDSSSKYIKFYSDRKDIPIDNALNEKEKYALNIEIVDREIGEVNKEIEKNNTTLTLKSEEIKSLEEKINKLNEEKKYQVKEEKEKAESEINLAKQKIETLNKDIEKLNMDKENLKLKIEKLNEKKADIEKNNK